MFVLPPSVIDYWMPHQELALRYAQKKVSIREDAVIRVNHFGRTFSVLGRDMFLPLVQVCSGFGNPAEWARLRSSGKRLKINIRWVIWPGDTAHWLYRKERARFIDTVWKAAPLCVMYLTLKQII